MARQSKILVIAAVIIIVLAGTYFGLRRAGVISKPAPPLETPTIEEQPAPAATSTEQTTTTKQKTASAKKPAVPLPAMLYSEAINVFANKRIQITENCQLIPSSMVVKNGTSIMFDNRTADLKLLRIDSREYYIEAYNFKIIPLSEKTLPHTVQIDCGSGRNNGQITLN